MHAFNIKTDTLQLVNSLYDLNREWFWKNINSAVFVGLRKSAEENYIIQELSEHNTQCLRLEVWRPNCEQCKDDVRSPIINENMLNMKRMFVPQSVDMIFAKQVLEHVALDKAMDMLLVWAHIARKIVLVESPQGEYVQGAIDGNPYEEHKSSLLVKHFHTMGYNTYVGGYLHEESPRHILAIYQPTKKEQPNERISNQC